MDGIESRGNLKAGVCLKIKILKYIAKFSLIIQTEMYVFKTCVEFNFHRIALGWKILVQGY